MKADLEQFFNRGKKKVIKPAIHSKPSLPNNKAARTTRRMHRHNSEVTSIVAPDLTVHASQHQAINQDICSLISRGPTPKLMTPA